MTRVANPVVAALFVACSSGDVTAQNVVENPMWGSMRWELYPRYPPSFWTAVNQTASKYPNMDDEVRAQLDRAMAALKKAKTDESEKLAGVS